MRDSSEEGTFRLWAQPDSTVASLQNYLAMSWIRPSLRMQPPIKIYNFITSAGASSASPYTLATQAPSLEPATDHQLPLLQVPKQHLGDIFPELPAPQG